MSMSGSAPRLEASEGTWTPWGTFAPPDVDATLTRFYMTKEVTMGRLVFHGRDHTPIYTLELPWRDNQRSVSCIPPGTYECAPYTSQKYPDVCEVLAVPDRTAILFHTGNGLDDTEGCILPGMGLIIEPGKPFVTSSGNAMALIRGMMQKRAWRLRVVEL